MTIPTSGSLSISDLKTYTGLSANNVGSYYRSSNQTGWTPASGTICFSDFRGGYPLVGRTTMSYNYSGYYGSDCLYNNTITVSNFSGIGRYRSYKEYGNAFLWAGPNGTSTTTYTQDMGLHRIVSSGWPAVSSGTYGQYHPGGTIPFGATGSLRGDGVEKIYIFRVGCSMSAEYPSGYYYRDNYYIELNFNQAPTDNIFFSYDTSGQGSGVYNWIGNSNYGFGIRMTSSNGLYTGRYNWPSYSASDPIYAWQEISMFGSLFGSIHPNNQWSFAFNVSSGMYLSGGSATLSLYPNGVWQKNCYNEDGWLDINGGAGTPYTQTQLTQLNEFSSVFTGYYYGPTYPD